ncbi:MAG: hypothetical protein E4G77_00170 [Nitrosopumilus sp.]|nr:MAG: hypothetical protein E4G77_00170 [Nitrosopumilus sp.]
MGKQVLGIPFEKELRADYINGNNLDCRKSNLRIATVSQINIGSTGSLDKSKKTSKYIGVSHKHDERRNHHFWRASITPSKGEPIIEVLFPFTDEGEIESAKK